MQLNILIQGQSNAAYLLSTLDPVNLATAVENLLGFDGVSNSINLLGGNGTSTFYGTPLVPGGQATPAFPSWLNAAGLNASQPWSDGPEQGTIDSYLASLPADERSAPTAIVWLHNEDDGLNPSIGASEWASAVAYAIGENRAALGQAAGTTPVLFVNVPFDGAGSVLETLYDGGSAQSLRQGMQSLIDSASFNASWGAQVGDSDMDGTDPSFGGQHFDTTDLAQLTDRLALSIADQFAQYALPGSPIATDGPLDAAGPSIVSAAAVPGQPDQILVQLSVPANGGGLAALSQAASQGAGWTVQYGATTFYATQAQLVSGDQMLLSFDGAVPTDGGALLYYGFGSGRIYVQTGPQTVASTQGPGQGSAVYDGTGLPLQLTADGIAVSEAGVPPSNPAPPTILGDVGTATLGGTAQNAEVALGDGTYTVLGGQGFAEVDGGTGEETVLGSSGDLTVRGGLGSAEVVGGAGALYAAGGLAGHDLLVAGAGDAYLFGTEDDTLVGGSGSTFGAFDGDGVFFGDAGAATVVSAAPGPVNLTVVGGAGNLSFREADGNNYFWGGSGEAIVDGGTGNDFVADGSGDLFASAGSGSDTIFGGTSGNSYTQAIGGTGSTIFVSGLGENLVYGGPGSLLAWLDSGISTVAGGGGAATVVGSLQSSASLLADQGQGDETLFGGAGSDTVYCSANAQAAMTFVGGTGAATLIGGLGPVAAWAGAGATDFVSGQGSNLVSASKGNLTVATGASSGATDLFAASGNATILGGGGGPISVNVTEGSAGGSYALNGFRAGTDHVFLAGYSAPEIADAIADANQTSLGMKISLSDNTTILLVGVDAPKLGSFVIG